MDYEIYQRREVFDFWPNGCRRNETNYLPFSGLSVANPHRRGDFTERDPTGNHWKATRNLIAGLPLVWSRA